MKIQDYFFLGCKLFGIYCLFLSIPYFAAAIPAFATQPQLGNEYHQMMLVTTIVTWLVPIVYFIAGLYLLKSGKHIYDFAYQNIECNDIENLEEKFKLFLKMLGVYLIVIYFPDLLKSISGYFIYTNAPKYLELFQEKKFTYFNFAPSVGAILLGLYLLKSGKIFINMGFNKTKDIK